MVKAIEAARKAAEEEAARRLAEVEEARKLAQEAARKLAEAEAASKLAEEAAKKIANNFCLSLFILSESFIIICNVFLIYIIQ